MSVSSDKCLHFPEGCLLNCLPGDYPAQKSYWKQKQLRSTNYFKLLSFLWNILSPKKKREKMAGAFQKSM